MAIIGQEVTAADYEAYQAIVKAVSEGITKGVNDSLQKLKTATDLVETVTEAAASRGEDAPDPAEVKRLYNGFWKLATGVDAQLRWKNISGVPERSYMNVNQIDPTDPPAPTPTEAQPEFSIGVSAFGVGLGVSW